VGFVGGKDEKKEKEKKRLVFESDVFRSSRGEKSRGEEEEGRPHSPASKGEGGGEKGKGGALPVFFSFIGDKALKERKTIAPFFNSRSPTGEEGI